MSGKTAREERRQQRLEQESETEAGARRRRLLQLGSAAAFVAVLVIAVLIVVSQSQTEGGKSELEDVDLVRAELAGMPQSGMVLGEEKAKVTLIEFGDLQCPVCKTYAEEIVPAVIESKVRTGEAKIEFRNFTIIGQESVDAGAAAVAAGQQGRGWNFVDLFYRNQGREASGYVTDDFLTEVARGAGVADIGRWNRDRKSTSIGGVERTTAEAQRLGLTGTPTFAVLGPNTDGLEVLGTPGSAEPLEAAIDRAG
jgi:protein-disulfide isomerase